MESTKSSKKFYDKPVFGFISLIVGVIGIILFVISKTSPDLVYYVNPARATVVRSDQSSRIHVEIDGKDVKRNVTAAQVIIWNDGEDSIRGQNLLDPLVIETGRLNPIIEVDIKKVTREVIGLQLDKSKVDEGQLGVDWTILEQGDGAVLQLIYYGDDQTLITASATVEQQGKIRELEDDRIWVSVISLIFLLTVLLAALLIIIYGDSLHARKRLDRVLTWLFLVFGTLMIITMIYYYGWAEPNPPVDLTGF